MTRLTNWAGSKPSGSEQRYYNQGKLTNQIKSKSGDSSMFFHAEGIALCRAQGRCWPKVLMLANDQQNTVLCES